MRKTMPRATLMRAPDGLSWDCTARALARWAPDLTAAATDQDATISMFEVIGGNPWSDEGVTAKRVAGALRSIGAKNDVTVLLNSPGGNVFEGLAIYNMLRDHQGHVKIKVLGVAASIASVIAMAGDEILIAKSAYFMVHNSLCVAVGNRLDLREIADFMEPIDAGMASIYAEATGMDAKACQKLMDAETWINGTNAIDQGFAHGFLPADAVKKDPQAKPDQVAAHALDKALAAGGISREDRHKLINAFRACTQIATGDGTQIATGIDGTQIATDRSNTVAALRSFKLNI